MSPQLQSNKQAYNACLPRVVILAAHINSFIHVAVGRAVLTRPLHDAVRTGTITKHSERLSHEPLEPQSRIHAHVLLWEHPPKKRKHAPSHRMEVSNFIPLIIDSAQLQHSRSAPEGPRSVRNTLHKKGDGVSEPDWAWTQCADRQEI